MDLMLQYLCQTNSISKVNATVANPMEMSKRYFVETIGRRSIGRHEVVNECDSRETGYDIWALSRIARRDKPTTISQSEYCVSTKSAGKEVNVYILDSGIDVGHSELRESTERCTNVKAIVGDREGHGTAVASLVAGKTVGLAPLANLIDVKVTKNDDVSEFDLIEGLSWVKDHSKDKNNCIANISMTFPVGVSQHKSLINQIDYCYKAGVTIVVAAGNHGASASDYLPAKLPQCITVASSTQNDQLAEHSNHGKCVDVVAPGEDIKVAAISGNQDFALKSGTSLATPIVSGVIARYLSEVGKSRTPYDVATWLKEHCTPNKLAPCGDTPNLLVYAPCSMIGRPCPRDHP